MYPVLSWLGTLQYFPLPNTPGAFGKNNYIANASTPVSINQYDVEVDEILSYDGNTLSTIVHIPSHSVSEAAHIELRRATGSMAARAQLDGFAGAIVRLHSAYDILNQQWSFIWSPDPLIDAWQAGDRLSYRPETARDELSHFAQRYNSAQASVQQLLEPIENLPDDRLSRQLSKRGHNVAIEQAQLYKTALKRALAQLQDGNPN